VLGRDEGNWNNSTDFGCQLQGFYSQFGSVAGMMASTLMAYMTWSNVKKGTPYKSAGFVVLAGLVIFAVSLGIALYSLNEYVPSGGGFCYVDFSTSSSAGLFIITVLAFATTIPLHITLIGATAHIDEDNMDRVRGFTAKIAILMMIGFISAWFLWLPAFVIGWTGEAFPSGFMLFGGIFCCLEVFFVLVISDVTSLRHPGTHASPCESVCLWRSMARSDG